MFMKYCSSGHGLWPATENLSWDAWAVQRQHELRVLFAVKFVAQGNHGVGLDAQQWARHGQFMGWVVWGLKETRGRVSQFHQASADSCWS